jgi:hypothetical protein
MRFQMYYDRQGRPIEDTLEWAALFEQWQYRYISQQNIGNYRVSTLWFGLNWNWADDTPVGIFETALFKDGEFLDLWRSNTQGEAVYMHLLICSTVSTMLVRQLGTGSRQGESCQQATATMDGQLTVTLTPSELTSSSDQR